MWHKQNSRIDLKFGIGNKGTMLQNVHPQQEGRGTNLKRQVQGRVSIDRQMPVSIRMSKGRAALRDRPMNWQLDTKMLQFNAQNRCT